MASSRWLLGGALVSILLVGCANPPRAKAPATAAIDQGASGSHGPAKGEGPDPEIQKNEKSGKGKVSLATVVAEQPKTLDDLIDDKMDQLVAEAEKPPPEPEEEPAPKPKPKPKRKKPKPKK